MAVAIAEYGQAAPFNVRVERQLGLNSHSTPDVTEFPEVNSQPSLGSPSLLLIGDSPHVGTALNAAASKLKCHLQVASSIDAAVDRVHKDTPDVIVIAWDHLSQSAKQTYGRIRRINLHVPIVVITGANGSDIIIEVIQLGAFDCLLTPIDSNELEHVLNVALNVARQSRTTLVIRETTADPDVDSSIVGNCPAMREVYKAIGRVADKDVTVLVTGESGTGKELVAHAIYQHSHRAKGPFLAINCAAIPEHLLESELFGHEKGAFTGADCRRLGKFEQCNGGTIFLDEIGDLPMSLQAKMLRLLQHQSFQRVGGSDVVVTDVRLIAATHHDLKVDLADGKFRSDLYHRLAGFKIHLPPLRERGNDLTTLIEYYLRRCNLELGRDVREIAPQAMDLLRRYSWPGNIRELRGTLRHALLQAHGRVLIPAFLPDFSSKTEEILTTSQAGIRSASVDELVDRCLASRESNIYAEAHRNFDYHLLRRVLDDVGGNQSQAARRIGIARETLRRRLRQVGLMSSRGLTSVEQDQMSMR